MNISFPICNMMNLFVRKEISNNITPLPKLKHVLQQHEFPKYYNFGKINTVLSLILMILKTQEVFLRKHQYRTVILYLYVYIILTRYTLAIFAATRTIVSV